MIRNERHALIVVGTSYKLAPAGVWPLDWFRKDWDLALWNKNGAYYPPKSGSSPPDLPEGFFMFKKNEEPILKG